MTAFASMAHAEPILYDIEQRICSLDTIAVRAFISNTFNCSQNLTGYIVNFDFTIIPLALAILF